MKQIKKSVGGLDFLKNFMIALSILIVLAFAMVLMNSNLQTSLVSSGSAINETCNVNSSGCLLAQSTLNKFSSPVITAIYNGTGANGVAVQVGNATIINNRVYNATANNYKNASISYSYNYVPNADADNLIGNYTAGMGTISTSITTWITLVGLVVIISIIAVVIYLVSKFGGTEMG